MIMVVTVFSGCCYFSPRYCSPRAERDFKTADSLYRANDHWNASFAFQKIVAENKDSVLSEKALLYQGFCYDSLYLYDITKTTFRRGLDQFPRSEFMPDYHAGIMSADYAMEYYDSVCMRYDSLEKAGVTLLPQAKLVKGKALYKLEKFGDAKKLLEQIEKIKGMQCEAGTITGLCCIKLKEDTAAMEKLKTVVDICSSNAPEACLNLGHLYFDKGYSISSAIKYYNMIPDSSLFYEEALLGICWSYMKKNKAKNADSCTDISLRKYPESPFLGEILLIKGYAQMLLNRRDLGCETISRCYNVLKKWRTDSIINQKVIVELDLQIKKSVDLLKVALIDSSITSNESRKIDLYKHYSLLACKMFVSNKGNITAENFIKFSSRKDQVLCNAEYACAFVTPMYPVNKNPEQLQKTKEEKKLIEVEKKKIEEELRKLEESNAKNPQ
jgi:tetratricopeptide (TPR) repeat protein